VDESVLTGESESVAKGEASVTPDAPLSARHGMLWMGTTLTSGRARGLVVATGLGTEFGRIARLTRAVDERRTPLQQSLGVLGTQLGVLGLAVSALVAVAGWWLGKPAFDMFLTGVSLAVAVVPEGLPALVTITLAVGIRAMVRRRALLRRLSAAEALGRAFLTGDVNRWPIRQQVAAVSVGVFEGQSDLNTLIVRTDAGAELVAEAERNGYLILGDMPLENLDHLTGAAENKKKNSLAKNREEGLLDSTEDARPIFRFKDDVTEGL